MRGNGTGFKRVPPSPYRLRARDNCMRVEYHPASVALGEVERRLARAEKKDLLGGGLEKFRCILILREEEKLPNICGESHPRYSVFILSIYRESISF